MATEEVPTVSCAKLSKVVVDGTPLREYVKIPVEVAIEICPDVVDVTAARVVCLISPVA